jgi:hypothetical protein
MQEAFIQLKIRDRLINELQHEKHRLQIAMQEQQHQLLEKIRHVKQRSQELEHELHTKITFNTNSRTKSKLRISRRKNRKLGEIFKLALSRNSNNVSICSSKSRTNTKIFNSTLSRNSKAGSKFRVSCNKSRNGLGVFSRVSEIYRASWTEQRFRTCNRRFY